MDPIRVSITESRLRIEADGLPLSCRAFQRSVPVLGLALCDHFVR